MKIKLLFYLLFITVFSSIAFAQSVVITPKKVTYRRPKPEAEYKKSFTVTYPKVKASSPALSKKIETTLSFEKTLGLNLKEEMGEIQWLEEASYDVNYNKKGFLDINLLMEGSQAYPSSSHKTVVVDLKTGNRVKVTDVFTNLTGLAARCRKQQQDEIKAALVEIKKESPDDDPKDLFKDTNFTVKNLDEFTISDKGVTFIYDYEFPHAIQALQPDGEYAFTWAELKPYIKPGGLFQKFVR